MTTEPEVLGPPDVAPTPARKPRTDRGLDRLHVAMTAEGAPPALTLRGACLAIGNDQPKPDAIQAIGRLAWADDRFDVWTYPDDTEVILLAGTEAPPQESLPTDDAPPSIHPQAHTPVRDLLVVPPTEVPPAETDGVSVSFAGMTLHGKDMPKLLDRLDKALGEKAARAARLSLASLPTPEDLVERRDLIPMDDFADRLAEAIGAVAKHKRKATVTMSFGISWDEGFCLLEVHAAVKSKRPVKPQRNEEVIGDEVRVLCLKQDETGQTAIDDKN